MASGIDTFFDKWEIKAGDSIRQKVDHGFEGCTDFLVILSENSILKPWVNAELDAGFAMRLAGHTRLIPLRVGLTTDQLPPLLRGLRSPSLDAFDESLRELISTIHGVVDRPELGPPPAFALPVMPQHAQLSPVAGQIAAYFVRNSLKARNGDPQMSIAELRALVPVPDDELVEAVDELEARDWARPIRAIGVGQVGFSQLWPTPKLFAALDSMLMPWNPADDARLIAAEMVNSGKRAAVTQLLGEQLGWGPRRINPALVFLAESGAIDHSNTIHQTYQYSSISTNARTRRFLG